MSRRILLITLISLAWIWSNLAAAQPAAQSGALERTPKVAAPRPPAPFDFGAAEEQSAPDPKQRSPKEQAIEHRLREPISICLKDVPLKQALKDLSVQSGIQVVPDMLAFEKARIDLNAPVSIAVENLDMKSALRLLLDKMQLTFAIENDVLLITTRMRNERMLRVTYSVGDLIAPLPGEGHGKGKAREALLIELITETAARNSWERMGGQGTIQYFPLGKSLVVTNSAEIQDEVQLLLATLRKLNELTASVETRFAHVSAENAERWRKEMAQNGSTVEVFQQKPRVQGSADPMLNPDTTFPAKGSRPFVSMTEKQIQDLLDIARNDRACSIIQAPRVDFFNGQRISLECTQKASLVTEFRSTWRPNSDLNSIRSSRGKETTLAQIERIVGGWRCELTPVVTPDRKSVRLAVNLEHYAHDEAKAIERVTKAARVFVLADESSLVWDLGETVERQHLFVVITPRIRVQPQEERIFQGEIERIPGR